MNSDLRAPLARLAFQLRLDLALHNIMTTCLRDETPGARLRQFGMMVLLMDLAAREAPLTVSTIVETTGMTRGAVEQVLSALDERGLIAAQWTKNSSGRGKARLYRLTVGPDADRV
ncbi:MarR family transcriptional regulator [Neoaquamicrobium microcysteis]|uniref:MarR family transcriptional regulator n=1 Tax=Neoaquamicrobium microcysteis TaxID=2682781 RepID=UPI001F205626|nr:MarR family transcriptional regulator [Mesorhizobium microcysteis]